MAGNNSKHRAKETRGGAKPINSPALLARNCSRRDATDVFLEVAVASTVDALSMRGTLLCV